MLTLAALAIIFGAEASPALHGSEEALVEKLDALRVQRAGEDAALDRSFAELMQRKYAAAWPNVPALSLVLERDGKAAMARGNTARAKRLFEFARDLSPSLLGPRLSLIHARLLHDPKDVAAVSREIASAVRVWASDYRAAHVSIANTVSVALIALLLVCFATLALVCARQWRYVAHDVSLLMPRGSSHWLAYALFVLLLGLPVAFRFGFLSIAFVLLLLPFFHAETAERVALSLGFIAVLAAPLLIEPIARTWVATEGRAADLYAVTRTNATEDALRRLEAEPESFETAIATGLAHARGGDVETALGRFERATRLQPQRADAWVNYGVALFWLERLEPANAAFNKAVELDPQSIPGLFNSARMLHRAGEAERGTVLLQRAQAADQPRTAALVAISRMLGPRFMAAETLPNEDLWKARPYAVEKDMALAAAQAVLPYMIGSRDARLFVVVGFAWLAVLWAIAFTARGVELALPCPRCGRPICLRTDKELPDRSLCGQCYHAFVLQDVDTTARIAKEVACRRHERRRAQLVTFSSIVLAGAGHLLRGRAVFGMVLVLFAGSALVLGFVALSVLPMPFRTGAALNVFRLVLAALVWLGAAAVALVTVPKRD